MRATIEQLLGHDVVRIIAPDGGLPAAAVSVAGDPPRLRVAFVDVDQGTVVARVAVPPGVPSRFRPVVASTVALDGAALPRDRVLLAQVAGTAVGVRPIVLDSPPVPAVPAGPHGVVALRLRPEALLVAVDAVDRNDEAVGRLVRAGISELVFDGVSVGGHLRSSHGLGAGIGAGHWVRDIAEAAFEAGFTPALPAWLPPGFAPGRPHIEPDGAYPAAPPAVVLRWEAADGARVLVRQTPAPIASPDPGGAHARPTEVNGSPAVLRGGRMLMTLIWEGPVSAFGVQVRGMVDPEAVALRVARSIAPPRDRP